MLTVPPASGPAARSVDAGRLPGDSRLQRLLRVPLTTKMVGANGLLVLAAAAAWMAVHGDRPRGPAELPILVFALSVALVVNALLVRLAMRPVAELEETVAALSHGASDARVPSSPLADRDLHRVGEAFNALLDMLQADRVNARRLAFEVVRAADRERSYLARELHDSTAQSLVALSFQLGAATNASDDAARRESLAASSALANRLLNEVRALARRGHSRVLEDLGLEAALAELARESEQQSGTLVEVVSNGAVVVSPAIASVLFRVAQEAVTNALRHGTPGSVRILLGADRRVAALEVADDGGSFDVGEAERRRPGMGLFMMRERLALVGGALTVLSQKGQGTRVLAEVPLNQGDGDAGR